MLARETCRWSAGTRCLRQIGSTARSNFEDAAQLRSAPAAQSRLSSSLSAISRIGGTVKQYVELDVSHKETKKRTQINRRIMRRSGWVKCPLPAKGKRDAARSLANKALDNGGSYSSRAFLTIRASRSEPHDQSGSSIGGALVQLRRGKSVILPALPASTCRHSRCLRCRRVIVYPLGVTAHWLHQKHGF